MARGDLVWIAEADDIAEPGFLAEVTASFADPDVVMSYCQSQQIGSAGEVLAGHYLDYTADVSRERWTQAYTARGLEEIRTCLAIKNTIPNVSAVVFRREALLRALESRLDTIREYRIAGDWIAYLELLKSGSIAYTPRALNRHRRHQSSVTIGSDNLPHLLEVLHVQKMVRDQYELDPIVTVKARDYAQQLYEYFGLRSDAAPHVAMLNDITTVQDVVRPGPAAPTCARVLAFYLPQFHPIAENDRWWGKDFTEWTNVTKAIPLFPDHYQPHLPADLGFYDLRSPEVRSAQAELARTHSIEGFCYWHYWFNGKRLLERPFNEVLASGQPDFPFCLAWANESWSRRWLGEERDILLAQTYSPEDDVAHARWLTKAFADPRYIRVHGRPLFLIYRPTHLPDPRRTTDILRQECLRAGLPEPYLLGINAHCLGVDCRTLGFDGTLDFEPKLGLLPDAFVEEAGSDGVNPKLKIYDYAQARQLMAKVKPDFPAWYPCIFAGWDNTPRRGARGIIVTDNTPELFAAGLDEMVQAAQSKPYDDRLIFINAWNEWAEGNHLEPDLKHGLRFLEAVDKVNSSRMPS